VDDIPGDSPAKKPTRNNSWSLSDEFNKRINGGESAGTRAEDLF